MHVPRHAARLPLPEARSLVTPLVLEHEQVLSRRRRCRRRWPSPPPTTLRRLAAARTIRPPSVTPALTTALAAASVVAAALAERGSSALVVRGDDGLDEVTTTTTTTFWDCRTGSVQQATVDVADLGIPRATAADLRGGDAAENADIMRAVLSPGDAGSLAAIRDATVVNAAAALVAADSAHSGEAPDLVPALARQVERANAAISSGAASEILAGWVATGAAPRE